MQHPDEGTIHTWLDGELPPEEAAALEAHVSTCAECAAAVAEARGLVAASSRIVSALDIIPGGVIPAAPARTRAWYSSPQFRAAAALVVVASASLLVMKQQPKRELLSVADKAATASQSKPQAETPPVVMQAAPEQAAAVAQTVAPTKPPIGSRTKAVAEKKTEAPAEADQMARRSGFANTEAVTAAAPQLAEGRQGNQDAAGSTLSKERAALNVPTPAADASRRDSATLSGTLSSVIVSGLSATTGSAPALKVVKSDTTGSTVRTVYEPLPGTQVVLVEENTGARAGKVNRDEVSRSAAAPPPPPAATPQSAGINSISWTSRRNGKTYILSGPMAKEQLESIRHRLPADTR